MQSKILFNYSCKLLICIFLLCGCTTKYVAENDADLLVAAMQDLPEVQPYTAMVHFYPELDASSYNAKASKAENENLKTIIYSESEMLNQAGHASIFRWFANNGALEQIPILNLHARIYTLDHSLRVEGGRMRPITKAKLEVFLTDTDKNRIYESLFTAEAEGELIKHFHTDRDTQDMYGYTIYRSLTLAFDSAFADISEQLHLQPSDFEVDELPLEYKDLEKIEEENEAQLSDAVIEDS